MLSYADTNELHVSEFPFTPAEQQHVYKDLNGTAVRCEPSQIIRKGAYRDMWRVTRIWVADRLIGYVRIDLDDLTVYMRPGNWQNREMVAVFTFGGGRHITQALRAATETLLTYDMYQLVEETRECGMSNPDGLGGVCTAKAGHVAQEPAHVDENGSVWYD